ncbi:MAG: hypothetical protein ACKO1I_17295, partial [Microcystis aeruginosa]
KIHENSSIGVLLCRDKDDEVVEYMPKPLTPTLALILGVIDLVTVAPTPNVLISGIAQPRVFAEVSLFSSVGLGLTSSGVKDCPLLALLE